MAALQGIISTQAGHYVMASLLHVGTARQKLAFSTWNMQNRLKSIYFLHRGIHLGTSVCWKSKASLTGKNVLFQENPDAAFIPVANKTNALYEESNMADNLVSVVPDDAFLCSIPLFLGDPSVHSFLSVYNCSHYCKIGIVRNKELVAAFTMPVVAENGLDQYFFRLKHYCRETIPGFAFPEYVYILGTGLLYTSNTFISCPLQIQIGKTSVSDEPRILALGTALSSFNCSVPKVHNIADTTKQRRFRLALFLAALTIFAISALAFLVPTFANVYYTKAISAYEQQYQATISHNVPIKNALAQNEALGKSILSLESDLSKKTCWGRFLTLLGSCRPSGLYLDKLGSDVIPGKGNLVKIALSGAAQNETLVTDFMSQLQKQKGISSLSLSALEHSDKKVTHCEFRIVCTFNLNEQ
jgi:Tfp pilus assembly protein PilN